MKSFSPSISSLIHTPIPPFFSLQNPKNQPPHHRPIHRIKNRLCGVLAFAQDPVKRECKAVSVKSPASLARKVFCPPLWKNKGRFVWRVPSPQAVWDSWAKKKRARQFRYIYKKKEGATAKHPLFVYPEHPIPLQAIRTPPYFPTSPIRPAYPSSSLPLPLTTYERLLSRFPLLH